MTTALPSSALQSAAEKIDLNEQRQALEALASLSYGDEAVSEIIRPAAVLPENAARLVLAELMHRDVRNGGPWLAEPALWRRYDRDWINGDEASANLIGTLQVAYGTPTRYEITVFRATLTQVGTDTGWTVSQLCDEAFGYGGLTLASCPRASLVPPPRPFRLPS
jgi:hypothetical protein